ncbi:polyhomeotic-like protein 2 isoform X3 [Erpetoichthys calabaricus]|uniref:polyhomeotic-like protein 2 isoform X3 n=1 Tax=Erpetoichthys calabaricus TaxID=27687 RepID=UPI00109FEF62|nr:polyhomeotic-like protein 2 isoform X3 [Erpetoichthys calabaricus]
MENEQATPASSASSTTTSASSTTTTTSSNSTTSNGRPQVPQISVYSGIPDRQTVQVIQQALHRQPNTAAQYLQQMYAAQQQHLMLQTAALQQQHLSSAQLQSLAAVQQAVSRQNSTQNGTVSQQAGSSQTTINLATSPAAAQLISRAQSVNSAASGIAQQAVLLGNASSPTLTASQAQMYLRAQMAQQSNLVQVARSLGRAVPLSPQLIFTPAATVTAVQPEVSTQSAGQQSTNTQVQNLAVRSQQGTSPSQTPLQSLGLKPVSSGQPPPTTSSKILGQSSQTLAAKSNTPECSAEATKKGESPPTLEARMVNVSRNVTPVTSHPLITPAYTQIQPHQLIQQQQLQNQQKQIQQQQQFVIQQQQQQPQQIPQRTQTTLLHSASIQPLTQAQPVQALTIQAPQASTQSQQCTIPVLPKPPVPQSAAPTSPVAIFHSTLGPQALVHNGQTTTLSQPSQLMQPSHQPVQVAAVNLQIQPTPLAPQRPSEDGESKENGMPREEKEGADQQPVSEPAEQHKSFPGKGPERANGKLGVGPAPNMTSGNGNNTSTVPGSTPQNGESKPPQAIVKPQILTHVIEGFVIQEGAEPFPVGRPALLIDNLKKQKLQQDSDKPSNNSPHTTDLEMENASQQAEVKNPEEEEDAPKLKCELCGRVDFAYKFKRSKRFCSMACAKRYNVGCTKRVGLFHPDRSKNATKSDSPKHRRRRSRKGNQQSSNKEPKKTQPNLPLQTSGSLAAPSPLPSHPSRESSQGSDISSYEEPPSPLSAASSGPLLRRQGERVSDAQENSARELPLLTQHFLPSDPTKWNVEDVYEFIRSLPGCQEIADEFRSQEIDGQALLLLKEDHLMSAMNIKLGPALKIYARISMLKDS